MKNFHPILSLEDSKAFEEKLLNADVEKSYNAMESAGRKVAEMFLSEFLSRLPRSPKILALIGTGHNGGDALIAIREISENIKSSKIFVVLPPENKLKQNTKIALEKLRETTKLTEILASNSQDFCDEKFDVIFDGLLGMSYTPPLRNEIAEEIKRANAIDAKIRAAIDIPSGAANTTLSPIFKADVTYATGICKDVLFEKFNREFVGRIRYADIGFFDKIESQDFSKTKKFIVSDNALDILKKLRPAVSDKRSFGHLFIIAGSRDYGGAAMLSVKAALRAGVGLVTAFVPESLAPAFAAQEPSTIWSPCPEDENGAIALESFSQIRAKLNSATALLAGSGITQSRETLALILEVLKAAPNLPVVLDADAIRKETAQALSERNAPSLLTPHEGEILRIARDASDESLIEACKKYNTTIALKSSATRVCDGKRIAIQTRGCPALARAGSGDILAGICGALMANKSIDFENRALSVGALGSIWLGKSAEIAATEFGETALATSDIIKFIPRALRD